MVVDVRMNSLRWSRSIERVTLIVLPALIGFGCGGAPVPAPAPASSAVETARQSTPLAARWVSSNGLGHRGIGPTIPAGTLVLLGGRRALLTPDGTLQHERVPAPEVLAEIIAVPTTSGFRLFGLGQNAIYRFDDPLGEARLFVRLESNDIAVISPGPGLVALWNASRHLRGLLDAETGRPSTFPGLPLVPATGLVFTSMAEGAAIFETTGLAVTTDGGAHWVTPSDESGGNDVRRTTRIAWGGNAVRARIWVTSNQGIRDELVSRIDIAGKRAGAFASVKTLPFESPLLNWIERTGHDPLAAVAESGFAAPSNTALVIRNGLWARIDVRTGLVLEAKPIAGTNGSFYSMSQAARVSSSLFIASSLDGDPLETDARKGPFGVFRVAPDQLNKPFGPPELVREGYSNLVATAAGGVMLIGACHQGGDGDTCIRQPAGHWSSVHAPFDMKTNWRRLAAAPLADGSLAILRGHSHDFSMIDFEPEVPKLPTDDGVVLRVITVGLEGQPHVRASVRFPGHATTLFPVGSIEELPNRTLRFVVKHYDPEENLVQPYIATVLPGDATITLRPVPNALDVRLHGEHGLAASKESLFITHDGGESWKPIPAPPTLFPKLRRLNNLFSAPDISFAASEMGAMIQGEALVGWGTPQDLPPPPRLETLPAMGDPITRVPTRKPIEPTKVLSCKTVGHSKQAPPADEKRPEPLRTSRAVANRYGVSFEEEGPESLQEPPTRWTIRWQDQTDPRDKPHVWIGTPPAGSTDYPNLVHATYADRRVAVAILAGPKTRIVRAEEGGVAQAIEVPMADDVRGKLSLGLLALGASAEDPMAWIVRSVDGATLFVWTPGTPARAIAAFSGDGFVTLEPPTSSEVLVRLEELVFRVPIPPPGSNTPLVRPRPEDWTRVPTIDMTALPICKGPLRSARKRISGPALRVRINGVDEGISETNYWITKDGESPCISDVHVIPPVWSSARWASLPTKPPKDPGPLERILVDFTNKRAVATGRTRGIDSAPGPVWPMRCSLEPTTPSR